MSEIQEHEHFHTVDFMDMTYAMSRDARLMLTSEDKLKSHRSYLDNNDPNVRRVLDILRRENVLDHHHQNLALIAVLAKQLRALQVQQFPISTSIIEPR